MLARYTQGSHVDEWLAELRSGTTSYYQADALSTVTSLSNSAGVLANTYGYDSFGNSTASTGTITNPVRYTGREFDSETGLYYYRARYLDSSIGRFLSEDPSYDESNFFEYVKNGPINFVDPFGLYTTKPGVPAPSPALDRLLKCMDDCVGAPIVVTSTTNGKHQDPGHAAGTSVDSVRTSKNYDRSFA